MRKLSVHSSMIPLRWYRSAFALDEDVLDDNKDIFPFFVQNAPWVIDPR